MTNVRFLGMPLRTRLSRRILVACIYGSFVLAAIVKLTLLSDYRIGWLTFGIPVSFLLVTGCILLWQLTRLYGVEPNRRRERSEADERQAKVRDQAMGRAYRTVSTTLLLLIVFGPPSPRFLPVLLCGVVLLTATLPHALIAWSEPDNPEDDDGAPIAPPQLAR